MQLFSLITLCNVFCRMYLCLFAGGVAQQLPKGLGTDESVSGQIQYSDTRSVELNTLFYLHE